jgi:hypothetical protein
MLAVPSSQEEEQPEFQGCGVPSAFADPSSYPAAGQHGQKDEEEGEGGDDTGDCLSELPRRTLTLRASGIRVSSPVLVPTCVFMGTFARGPFVLHPQGKRLRFVSSQELKIRRLFRFGDAAKTGTGNRGLRLTSV